MESNEILTEDTLSGWKKKDLEKWLADHNKKKSGKKQVLIHRIIRSLQFDNSDSESDEDSSSDDTNDGTDAIPEFETVKVGWETISTSSCPPTRQEDVDNYFIYNKNPVTGKTQGCHRQLKKARKFFQEKYVFDIQYNGLEESEYCYIKAKCKPSMKNLVVVGDGKLAKDYSLHVCVVKKTGKIEKARCNCKAGLCGLCSHVGGLLLTVVQIKNSCTSKPCEWLKPQTSLNIKPQRLRDINFSNGDAPIKPYPNTYKAAAGTDPDKFFLDIMAGLNKVNPNCVLYRSFNPDISDLTSILNKYQPPFMFHDKVDLNSTICQSEFRTFTMGIELNDIEIKRVQESTRGQSANPIWKSTRTNLITSSNFGPVCKKRPETVPDNLIAKLLGYNEMVDTQAMRYGRKRESQARRDYTKRHLEECSGVLVDTTGLIISKQFPFLGASVDGIVRCEKCGTGTLEIKCPFVGKNVTPEEYSEMKSSCIIKSENGELVLKENHNYMFQIMGQMKVLGIDWCDFVIWTKKGMNVQRVVFSEEFWAHKMIFKLKFFYNSFLMAEKFTNRIKRGKKLF